MPKLRVTLRSGAEQEIEATSGISVMESIREAGIYEILALCGGSRSCATCHVFVAEEWRAAVGAPSAPELELLELSPHHTSASRLSCQIEVRDDLDGMGVRIAPED
ncbi:MAG: 2Fe-2S iron-sulfur cluster-binding protein [Hyphomonadaceae bacterium]